MTRSSNALRWGVAVARMSAVVIGVLALVRLVLVLQEPFGQRFLGNDLNGYVAGARRYLETGSPYLPEQLTGSWQLQPDSFIHPPVALALFLPWVILPAILWWAIPLGLTLWSVARLRPAAWAWPVMTACLLWPRTAGILIAGNSDMWVAAAIATALAFGIPTAVLLVLKPSYLPLALIGVRHREWWIATVIVGLACVAFGSLWFDFVTVLRGATLEPVYSFYNAPYVAIPLLAWLGRDRRRNRRRESLTVESHVRDCQ